MRTALMLALLAIAALFAGPAPANARAGIELSADAVRFYANKYIVTGDGHVTITMPNGTKVSGEAFTMDLRLNRFVLAGDVTIDAGDTHLHGAGFSDFIDFKRQYFLPVGAEPDRWTFLDDDYTKPAIGRQMPGDAFELADPGNESPYNRTHYATIYPKTGVSFGSGSAQVLLPVPLPLPVPAYYVNFSANPNFAQNGFAGADYDVGVPFAGNQHAISGIHFRHDPINNYYFSFDQHFVSGHDWLVASVNPLTKSQKQYNLIGVKQFSPNVQVRAFGQFSTFEPSFLGTSKSAATYANLQVTAAFPHSYVLLNADQFNTSLITQVYEPYNYHPADFSVSWTGTDKKLGGPRSLLRYLTYGTRVAYGENYNGYTISTFAGTPYKAVYDTTYAFHVYLSSPLRVVKGQPFFFNAAFDKSRDYYSLPHHLDRTDTSFSLSYTPLGLRDKLNLSLQYAVANTGDYYGKLQSTYLAPASLLLTYTPEELAALNAAGYQGFATSRVLFGQAVYTASAQTTFIGTFYRHHDSPVPVGGIFGYPTYTAIAGVRSRIFPNIVLDVRRAYFFNFSNQYRWSPQFQITVSN